MSSINLMVLGLGQSLRYHQIDTLSLYEKIKEETSRTIVGNLPPSRWPELARGLWEATIEEAFRGGLGARFDEQQYDYTLCRKNMLQEDIHDIIQDGVSFIWQQVMALTDKTALDYKCGYKLMLNYNILVAIDERDFLLPAEPSTLEELFLGTQD